MHDSFDALLAIERVGYSLPDGRPLLDDLTLGFGRERTGLVGPNGIGKTTLARILAGELTPTRGRVVRSGPIGYLAQRRTPASLSAGPDDRTPAPPSDPRATGAVTRGADVGPMVAHALGVAGTLGRLERVLGGRAQPGDLDAVEGQWHLPERLAALLDRLGLGHIPLDRPLEGVSGGEATRIALARLLLDAPDFLILDEPTNDLDADARASLYRFVDEWTGGMLVVTHDRTLLGRVDRILELSGLGARLYGGDFALYEQQRAVEREAAERNLSHAREELRRTRRAAQETRERQERRAGRGGKEAKRGGMPKILLGARKRASQQTAGRLSRIGEGRIVDAEADLAKAKQEVEDRKTLDLEVIRSGLREGRRVVEAREVSLTYPARESGRSVQALAPVSLGVTGPERVALVGPNGAGKTTLLRILAGELTPDTGRVRCWVDPDRVAYLDQHAAMLDPRLSVLENFRRANPDLDPTHTRYTLARFLFRDDAALKPTAVLSGGERLRAALACALGAALPPQLLLLDEPTNHLDLDSLGAVEDAVAAYDGALVVVSHDEPFLNAVGVDRRIELRPGRMSRQAPGGRGSRDIR